MSLSLGPDYPHMPIDRSVGAASAIHGVLTLPGDQRSRPPAGNGQYRGPRSIPTPTPRITLGYSRRRAATDGASAAQCCN